MPKLSDAARHLILPAGITRTDWPEVADALRKLRIQLDPWQVGAASVILGKRDSGVYAASIGGVVMSIPRQVGKSFLLGALVFALCLCRPGLTVIWTAHRVRTSAETFSSMQALALRKSVAPYVERVRRADGEEAVEFKNRSRILFGARESGFGRGFSRVGVLVLDEAQILTEKTLEDMVPATNQAENPLILLTGTPPRPADPGDVFRQRRRDALDTGSGNGDTLYIEFSAEHDAEPGDRKQWRKANPSFPVRTPETAVLRMRKMLGEASFRREALGIWDDDRAGSRAIPSDAWSATEVDEPPGEGTRSFGVAFSADGRRVALAGAVRSDEAVHVELVDAHAGSVEAGIGPLADWLAVRWRETAGIAISGRAGAATLAQLLKDRGVPDRVVQVATSPQYFTACAMFLDAVREGTVTHPRPDGPDLLDASVAVADQRPRGRDGSWSWQATTPDGDETPVEAVSLAHWMARTSRRDPQRRSRVVVA